MAKKEKIVEPQYYVSKTNQQVLNYRVYYMSLLEKIIYILLAFAVGAAVGYLFYGGIGKDEYDNPTTTTYVLNILIPSVVGVITAKLFLPMRTRQIIDKRKKDLNIQFRDMLSSLNTSLGAGKNVPDSFAAVYDDLKVQYGEGTYIINELEVILSGMNNNIDIEDMLADFGERSDNDDIRSFAKIFQISYRKGGNVKDIIRNSYNIISDKMEIQNEIETVVAGGKQEQYIMIVMPILLIMIIKMSSPDMAKDFVSGSGIFSTTAAIAIFAFAYWLGKELMDIKM